MADGQLDRLESFRVFIKAAEEGAIPPVAEQDLKMPPRAVRGKGEALSRERRGSEHRINGPRLQSRRESARFVAAPRST